MNLRNLLAIMAGITLIVVGFLGIGTHTAHAATFTVNSLLDTSDANPGNGACATAGSVCTLRAAIQESDALAGADIINFSVTGTTIALSSYGNLTDSAGLTINGPGSGDFEVDASGMSDNTVITMTNSDNGEISGITMSGVINGIWIIDSDGNTFDDLVISGRDSAGTTLLEVATSTGNTFTNNNLSHGGLGIRVGYHSDGNTISGNTSTHNVHSGITISNSANNVVTDNTISDITADYGMFVIGGADHNTFTGNTVTNANLGAMTLGGVAGDDSDTVNNNTISDNIFTGSGSGISMIGSVDHNTFEGNTVSDNDFAGITIAFNNLDDPAYLAEGNIFKGNTVSGNGSAGLDFSHALNITIGGQDPGEGNIITGNGGDGIQLVDVETVTIERNTVADNAESGISVSSATDITIQGNYIGLQADGVTLSSNLEMGINIGNSSDVIIGGTTSVLRNYIVGEGENTEAIDIAGTLAGISVMGNYIGLDKNGSIRGALGLGILLDDSDMSGVVVGGVNADEGNVIAGISDGFGIKIAGSHARVFGNKIGTDPSGAITDGYGNNFGIGILLAGSDNKIGGINAGEPNIVAGNTTGGVVVLGVSGEYPLRNAIVKNTIYGNGGNGIDIFNFEDDDFVDAGPNPNDRLDGDAGPNNFLNHPLIISAIQSGSDTVVTYGLDVPISGQPYRVEFFTNTTNGVSSSGFGEGETFIDSDEQTISSSGMHVFTKTLADVAPSDVITATTTECTDGGCTTFGATSEFSNSVPTGIDFGTADGDETEIADGGAYHILSTEFLGACVNADDLTHTDTTGPGSSYSGESPCTNDKDGVTGLDATFTAGDTMTATVTASEPGFLSVWMDLDNDGSFDGADEWLITSDAITGAQVFVLPIAAPSAGTYDIRFRYTTYDHDGLLATGEALDGEVEDYVITTVAAQSEDPVNPILAIRPITVSGGCPHDWLLVNGTCQYQKTNLSSVENILGSGVCPANLIIHDFMKDGDRNGKYSNYNKKIITEVNILQAHINRILAIQYKQAAGPVDGIFKSKTKLGVQRLQTALNQILKPVPILKVDGIVGPYTREAINRSCG